MASSHVDKMDFSTYSLTLALFSKTILNHWCMYSVSALLLFYSDMLLSVASSNNSRSQIIMEHLLYARHSISTGSCAKMNKM